MPAAVESRTLFTPLQVGDITLANRVVMAPLTRFRANAEHEHVEVGVEYYTQRSTPGALIITEATFLSPQAGGYPNVPMVSTDGQVQAWKKVVDAVHSKDAFLCMQLWALGRAAVADVLKAEGPRDVVSASDLPFEGGAVPRALTVPEIQSFVADYAQAAVNFIQKAGGDMVEIHGANGYLLDQFLQTTSNKRTDNYGGSVENRCRFLREAIAAVVAKVGAKKTGVRLSPFSEFQGMKMSQSDITETFSFLVNALKADHPDLAYIHVVEARIAGNTTIVAPEHESIEFLYKLWSPRVFIAAGGFDTDSAIKEAEDRPNTLVAIGRHYISNPDLIRRMKEGIPLAPYDRDTFYLYGPQNTQGYTDYPVAA